MGHLRKVVEMLQVYRAAGNIKDDGVTEQGNSLRDRIEKTVSEAAAQSDGRQNEKRLFLNNSQ